MKLFLLTTRGKEEYYVVAPDPTAAIDKLKEVLARSEYSGYGGVEVITTKLVAIAPDKDLKFMTGKNLILDDL